MLKHWIRAALWAVCLGFALADREPVEWWMYAVAVCLLMLDELSNAMKTRKTP